MLTTVMQRTPRQTEFRGPLDSALNIGAAGRFRRWQQRSRIADGAISGGWRDWRDCCADRQACTSIRCQNVSVVLTVLVWRFKRTEKCHRTTTGSGI
jgi:hypothetical protein